MGHGAGGCAVAAADDKAVAAAVIGCGTYYHSDLGCPTLDCYCYRTAHWIEVPG